MTIQINSFTFRVFNVKPQQSRTDAPSNVQAVPLDYNNPNNALNLLPGEIAEMARMDSAEYYLPNF